MSGVHLNYYIHEINVKINFNRKTSLIFALNIPRQYYDTS